MQEFRVQLNNGSIAGVASFVFFLLFHYAGFNPFGAISYIVLWLPFLFSYFTIKTIRDEQMEGYISYGQAFVKSGMMIFVWASLSGMLVYLFGFLVDDSWVEIFINQSLKDLEPAAEFLGEDLIESAVKAIEESTVFSLAWSDFQTKALGGLVVSFIMAAFLYKKPPFIQ